MSIENANPITFKVQTYGCKVNSYDSGLVESRLQSAQFKKDVNGPSVFILNSCAVTAESSKEAAREARKIKLRHPDSVVVLTGCSAQVDTESFISNTAVDLIVANSHKSDLQNIIKDYLDRKSFERIYKSNIFKKEDLEAGGGISESHTRAFLKIQDGCNSFCTFCVIPFARGKSRSLSIDHLKNRVNELLQAGSKEVVLTGVHIGDYEFGLENLIESILLQTRISRLRLTSLEPVELSDRLIELFQDPRLCPHFHMSIQSGSTAILKAMKRNYTSAEVSSSFEKIANKIPHAFVGMDVIAGFPGESDREFAETYDLLANHPWNRIHVFSYSERPGTYAVRIPEKNPHHVIHRRADQLRNLSRDRYEKTAADQVGSVKKVLVLSPTQGLSRDYWTIYFETELSRDLKNIEVQVQIIGLHPNKIAHLEPVLFARVIDAP